MIDIIIKNAAEILTCRNYGPKVGQNLDNLQIMKRGYLVIKDGLIVEMGLGSINREARMSIDATNKVVMPGFVDCHSHLVFAGSREDEFAMKIKGANYLEILKNGGGILSTVEKTRKTSSDDLQSHVLKMIKIASDYGTTTMEVKSGYGLNFSNELRTLLVVKNVKENQWLDLVPTLLGAHAVPPEFKKDTYIHKEIFDMIDGAKEYRLAEYCDVFVEKGAFSVKEAAIILKKARSVGLKLKLHAGEFNDLGGAELGAELGVSSIDHLDHISKKGMKLMAEKKIVGVLLPGVPFHLMTGRYAPALKMIEAGVPIALATDFNPGSCPTLSMQMIIALACRFMKLTPAQAINAATINAAYALDRGDRIGSLEVGKQADIIILDIPNHRQLPYWFGTNLVERVIKNGKVVK